MANHRRIKINYYNTEHKTDGSLASASRIIVMHNSNYSDFIIFLSKKKSTGSIYLHKTSLLMTKHYQNKLKTLIYGAQ